MRVALRMLMLLCLALGPGSLRMVHECTGHRHEVATVHGACDAEHHDAPASPRHEPSDSDHCVTCDDLATLSVDTPTPAVLPMPTLRARPASFARTTLAKAIDTPRIARGQPPPLA